jgi:hypothetical protein
MGLDEVGLVAKRVHSIRFQKVHSDPNGTNLSSSSSRKRGSSASRYSAKAKVTGFLLSQE